MQLSDILALALILGILAGAVLYVCRTKKKGRRCIGCPGNCSQCNK